ncbi:A disintegrin and metalloproteinase with thrombospondin motifs 7-like isoform X3 [Biomphalaria glabrata]|nr:A disintegrin and metalloproteinase with thrombospondin motifs 7-like isoform X3 [Biomphalaria glabrata]
MNAINIRDMHMKSSGRKSNRSKLRSAPQSRRRRNAVLDYYPQSRRRRNAVQDYYPQSRRRRNTVQDYYPQSRRRRNAVQDYHPQSRRRRNAVQDYHPQSRRRRNAVQDYHPQSRRRRNAVQDYYPQSRRRRNAVQDYYVDVAAVIDYKRYSMFLAQANYDNFTAMQNILEYYAFVFSAADMLYQGIKHPEYTIHILLSKVYVLQTVTSSSFIETIAGDDEMNGDAASNSIEYFTVGAGRGIVGFYDHVMLFTGYNLFRVDSNYNKKDTLGVTNSDSMCRTDGRSSSVIEDRKGYSTTTIDTVAHELAHSLSAKHDGEDNTCKASKRFIMGSSELKKRPGTEYNPWRFSSCSVKYFTSFLKEKMKTSRGYTCLVYAIEASADIPDVSDKLLGQLVKPDQQCQQLYGNNSYYCRASEAKSSLSDICLSMLCADFSKKICSPQRALMGTSCGDGKICINGHCVSDPYAPQLDENCAFGDRPNYSCNMYISLFKGNCYSTGRYQSCCDTCNNVSRPVKGCEYGDRILYCTQDHCLNAKEDCCGTCNYGTPFTPMSSTRRSTPIRLATTANPRVIFTPIKECEPGDQDLRPELCTNISVCLIQPAQCCHYCSLYYTSTTTRTTSPKTKCEPGDLDLSPEQCLSPSVCKTQPLLCCNYCSFYFKNESITTPTSPKECEPGDLDLKPELCTNTSVCQTNLSLCCNYCSLHYNSSTTNTTQSTSHKECVPGEPDLSPQLCTSPSICQTQPLMCCNYCSSRDNSASHLSLYTIRIYRCFCTAFYFLYIKTNVY